jgi:hypothetical protein
MDRVLLILGDNTEMELCSSRLNCQDGVNYS